jgi:predicted esterase
MVCHGYAQLARYFIRAFETLDDGTRIIVAPEALNRFYHTRGPDDPAQGARVAATWMTREDRAHEIDDYIAYLDALAAHVTADLTPSPRITAFGFSQGAATVSRWAALGHTPVDSVVLWGSGPAHDLPLGPATLRGARLLIVAGTVDPHLDAARLAEERWRLREAGVEHELIRYDGGHSMDPAALHSVAERLRDPFTRAAAASAGHPADPR